MTFLAGFICGVFFVGLVAVLIRAEIPSRRVPLELPPHAIPPPPWRR